MKVVILAAGRGKRMGEHTQATTKAMLPIQTDNGNHKFATKPMLQITIERFIECGFNDFVIVVGYRKNDIITHFGNGSSYHATIKYVTQKHICAGTADAVNCAKYFFDGDASGCESFVLVFGDVVPSIADIRSLHNKYVLSLCAVMGVRRVSDPHRYGVVELDTATNEKIVRIVEKSPNPPSNLINAGLYVFPIEIFDHIRKTGLSVRGEYELTDSIQMMIDAGRVIVKVQDVQGVQDIGTKEIYEAIKANN